MHLFYSKIKAFNLNINTCTTAEFVTVIEKNIINRTITLQQTGINAHAVVSVQHDKLMRKAINNSDLVNVDGLPVVWALNLLGYKGVIKATCADIFENLLKLANDKGYKPFFLGSKPEIIKLTIKNLKEKYPKLQIAGYHHGYFNTDTTQDIANTIKDSKADMLFLGISSPKKELFSTQYKEYMQVPYTLGVGGMFDIIAGKTKRAPLWMQNLGLEWFYRFIQEPRRMWKRYLVGNSKFIWLVAKEKFGW